jgi:L-arabinokinase
VLVAYVSGHGFGHLTRTCEVLREIRRRDPALPLVVVGAVPEALVRAEVPGPVELRPVACDVGLVQRDALEIDEPASAERCRAFDATWEERRAAEARFLRERGVRAVLADVPALPFAAAAGAGIPALGMSNFSWDWIYRHLARRQPSLLASAERAAAAYATATRLLELPFAGDLSAFPVRERVGFVARRPRVAREEARRRLGLDARPAVLLSFGGVGLPALRREALPAAPHLAFLLPEEVSGRLDALGLSYVDVVGAADVVVTKPGYGIVTDAIGAGTRMVYTDRGDFPEYPVMVAEMPRWLACVHVPSAELRAGRFLAAVERVLRMPVPPPPDLGGAARCAERVLEALGRAPRAAVAPRRPPG